MSTTAQPVLFCPKCGERTIAMGTPDKFDPHTGEVTPGEGLRACSKVVSGYPELRDGHYCEWPPRPPLMYFSGYERKTHWWSR